MREEKRDFEEIVDIPERHIKDKGGNEYFSFVYWHNPMKKQVLKIVLSYL